MPSNFTTSFVNVPIERLFEELILGAESFDKNISQVFEGFQTEVSLNRFQSSGAIEARNPVFGAGTLGTLTKNEKLILMSEVQMEFQLDPHEFNLDHEFLWNTGPEALQSPSPALTNAIMSVVGKGFNNNLEQLLWNGGVGTITGWAADIAAVDAAGDTIAVTPAGVITPTNVISIFEAIIAAATPEMKELDSPTIVTTHAVKYAYREAARALDFKGTNIDGSIADVFGGFPIVSTGGVPANNAYMMNASGGDMSELKAAVWANSDRFNVEMARTGPLDDTWGIKISFSVGTGTVYNGQIVTYLPV